MTTYVNHPFRCFVCTVSLMAMLWLTIGFSFAYNYPSTDSAHHFALEELNKNGSMDIPFEESSEEKAEVSSNDFTSDYLKEDAEQLVPTNIIINYNRHYTARALVNFCCDSVSPPPETSAC